jgi:serine/threonine protein kinase
MLKAFRGRKNHAHLIKLLATYNIQGNYHLVFPYADHSLRSYWQNKEPPQTTSCILWFLKQIKGIASGLALIHEFHASSTNSEWLHGRHGDIKPENILWFSDPKDDSNGVFQIADFGLSHFRTRSTRSQIDPANVGFSPVYAPPELSLKQPISRAYDIWSLGCVFLEFATWLTAGQSGLDNFRYFQAKSSNLKEHGLFTILVPEDRSEPRALVKESVTQWIQRLRTHRRSSEFILDLLILIDEGLLIADPKQRLNANDVDQALCMMLDRAKYDDTYLSLKSSSEMAYSQHLVVDHSFDITSTKPPTFEQHSKKLCQGFKTPSSLVSPLSGNKGNIHAVHHNSA